MKGFGRKGFDEKVSDDKIPLHTHIYIAHVN